MSSVITETSVIQTEKLADYPSPDGIAGASAGIVAGELLVAGGTNFIGKIPPWEGGKKQWSNSVFVLKTRTGAWELAGTLSTPLANAAAVTLPEGLLLIGGCDAEKHFVDVRLVTLSPAGVFSEKEFPSLPRPLAYHSAALLGNVVYVAGGLDSPSACETDPAFFALDLKAPQPRWEALPALPGVSRMLAAVGVCDGKFFVFGGVNMSAGARRYLSDAWCYSAATRTWRQLPDMPVHVAGAATPTPEFSPGQLFVFGGDSRPDADAAPKDVSAFSNRIQIFDTISETWNADETLALPGFALPAAASSGKTLILVGGESRPGYRSRTVAVIKNLSEK